VNARLATRSRCDGLAVNHIPILSLLRTVNAERAHIRRALRCGASQTFAF
jgi:hypothetical protein